MQATPLAPHVRPARSGPVRALRRASSALAALFAGALFAAAPALADTIEIVSPPNPHVFPLLVALHEHPELDVQLIAVSGGSGIRPAFDAGADGLMAMTYIAAKQRAEGAAPDLQLVLPATWRGFWEIAGPDVASFSDLVGETVIVSGPAGSGAGGGGDIIFRAAARRQGVDPDTDVNVVYMPVQEAQIALQNGEAAAIAVPAPASTGFELSSAMGGMTGEPGSGAMSDRAREMMARRRAGDAGGGPAIGEAREGGLGMAIDYQEIFSDFASFPEGQVPLGGLHLNASTLADPEQSQTARALVAAYAEAVMLLERQPMRYANIAASEFERYYADTGAPTPPAMVIAASIQRRDLVYRTDITVASIERDLSFWIEELLGYAPDAGFFNTDFRVAPALIEQTAAETPRERMRARFGGMRRN